MIKYLSIAFLFVLASCGGMEESGESNPPEDYKSRSGKTMYQNFCTACHGDDGKLGSAGAKDFTKSNMDSTQIVEILKNGKNGMPRQIQYFKSDEEVSNTVEYLMSLRK